MPQEIVETGVSLPVRSKRRGFTEFKREAVQECCWMA